MPRIHVLLPIYNAESTLEESIDSLLVQDADDLEILALDDGSTDGSGGILDACAKRDKRVRVHHLEHKGLVTTLNSGIQLADAPLIARMDADDRSHPSRFSRQAAFLDRHPDIDVVSCRVRCFPDVEEGFRVYERWINGLLTPDDIAREIFVESPLVHPSVMARREAIERVGGYRDVDWAEDYDLWLRMHIAGLRFGKVDEVLFEWREHPERLTRTDDRYSRENFIRAKAHYLCRGPLADSLRVLIWGGRMGRRLWRCLESEGAELVAYVDVDPTKVGGRRDGVPVIGPDDVAAFRTNEGNPTLLAAVASRGARDQIRAHLNGIDMVEGLDYLCVA